MQRKEWKSALIMFCLLGLIRGVSAQYTINGGAGQPYKALDDTRNRIEVWLVYGMENAQISYVSSAGTSTTHVWYKYKGKAIDGERINCTQEGSTSYIQDVEEGYGYYVEETGVLSRFVWIIDYSKYEFTIRDLSVADVGDPCVSFRLKGDVDMVSLYYSIPTTGLAAPVNRTFDVSYKTLEWSEENKMFNILDVVETIEGNPFEKSLKAPLCDTHIQLKGDYFARHFGVEKTAVTEEYSAVAVEVHADTLVTTTEYDNMTQEKEGYSAPTTILFTAYANDPVASLYRWKIYKNKDDESEIPLSRDGEEFEYTFEERGDYVIELELSDRTGTCTDVTQSFNIKISDSYLFVPNAFSPGSSPGVNDEFKVVYKSLNRFRGWIFNRWGNELFNWTDPSVGWDGKYRGKYVTPGVYFYVIEAEGSDGVNYKRKGHINILRSKTINDEIPEETE